MKHIGFKHQMENKQNSDNIKLDIYVFITITRLKSQMVDY